MKQLDTPIVVINIIALVVLGGSALFAMVVVPAIEAARPTPTVAVTPRPTGQRLRRRHPTPTLTPWYIFPHRSYPHPSLQLRPAPTPKQPRSAHIHPIAG